MADLILRKWWAAPPERPYALQLRHHDLGGTDYRDLCYVHESTAYEIVEAGQAFWLFGAPHNEGHE